MAQVSRDLDVNRNIMRRWKQEMEEHGAQAFPGQGVPIEQELARLRRENEVLRQEREVLKSHHHLLATQALKHTFIHKHKDQFSIELMWT